MGLKSGNSPDHQKDCTKPIRVEDGGGHLSRLEQKWKYIASLVLKMFSRRRWIDAPAYAYCANSVAAPFSVSARVVAAHSWVTVTHPHSHD